jgi:serine/threonine protein kinase, bacterial
MTDWPFETDTLLAPADFLGRVGRVFAVFDSRTQDSGNVSFGVEAQGRRWFVKTAGDPAAATFLSHAERVALLANAERLARDFRHPALPALIAVGGSAWGPMLIYDWAEGELLHAPAERRRDPATAFQRFRALPADEIAAAIGMAIGAHVGLCGRGWVACDFYDGSMMYDFAARRLSMFDLDSYSRGAFTNEMGRLFGSERFMAPEEFLKGARIDERTTVFNLGRAAAVFLSDGTLERGAFRGTDDQHAAMIAACRPAPDHRLQRVADLAAAWRS